jgi:hypothetical protein
LGARAHTVARTGGIASGLLLVLLLLLLLLLALLLLPVAPAQAQHASDDPVASAAQLVRLFDGCLLTVGGRHTLGARSRVTTEPSDPGKDSRF